MPCSARWEHLYFFKCMEEIPTRLFWGSEHSAVRLTCSGHWLKPAESMWKAVHHGGGGWPCWASGCSCLTDWQGPGQSHKSIQGTFRKQLLGNQSSQTTGKLPSWGVGTSTSNHTSSLGTHGAWRHLWLTSPSWWQSPRTQCCVEIMSCWSTPGVVRDLLLPRACLCQLLEGKASRGYKFPCLERMNSWVAG